MLNSLNWREWIALAFLLAQCGGLVRMFFVEDRLFAWAPHDVRADYTVTATHNGVAMSQRAIHERYLLPKIDWHAVGNLKLAIRIAEERQPPDQRWQVKLAIRKNLGPEIIWSYPEVTGGP
jgi:hypothetical protein